MGKIEMENLSTSLQQKINSGGSGGITLPISANDITENPSKVFVTSNEKAEISASTMENMSQTQRIASIENTLSTLSTTDEKVKMNSEGVSSYLSELIDGLTVVNNNGKLEVPTLKNLLATIQEINYLQGATSNIQAQINTLGNIGNYSTTVMTFDGLATIMNPKPQDMVIVLSDINHEGKSTIYIYNGTDWVYSGDFKGGEVRDFTTNPISLSTETMGLLQKTKYEKQNASETSFIDASGKIVAQNTNDAIIEVFQFADSLRKQLVGTVRSPLDINDTLNTTLQKFINWYSNVAEAISLKGVMTSSSNNGDEIIQKIGAIPNISVEGTIKKKSKIDVPIGGSIEVPLSGAVRLTDVTSTLLEFVKGAEGVVLYNLAFDNADKSNFIPNDFITFDGTARLKQSYDLTLIKDSSMTGGTFYYTDIDASSFLNINSITVSKKRGI